MSDEDAGDVDLFVEPAEPPAQFLANLGVERAERLVEQQDFGLDGERASERDALALTTGELRRPSLGQHVELHQWRSPITVVADFALRWPRSPGPHPEPEGHVLEHVMCRNSA